MDFPSLIRAAKRQGWTIGHTRAGHLKWLAPDGQHYVVTSATCSDHWGVYHAMQDLRRLGLAYPPASRKARRSLVLHRPFPAWSGLLGVRWSS